MDYKAVEAAMAQGSEFNPNLPVTPRENGFILPAEQGGAPPPGPPLPNIHDKLPTVPQAHYPDPREPESSTNHQGVMDPTIGVPSANADPNSSARMDANPNLDASMNSNPSGSGMGSEPSLNSSLDASLEAKHMPETGMDDGNVMPYEEGEEEDGNPPPNLFDTKSSNPILVRGSWQWMCNQCPKSYTSKSNLIAHLLDHCGIKPHMCLACGKSFKQVAHLNTHRVIHTGRRKHICPICGRGFNQRVHLKRHMVTHNINVACTCELCGRKFAFPSELQFHHKKVHRKRSGPPKKHNRGSNSDVDNLQHFNASATMHPMIASQGQMVGHPPPGRKQGRYPAGMQYMPATRRRRGTKQNGPPHMQAGYPNLPPHHGGRGPSNDHLSMSPSHMTGAGDHMPHGSNHMSPRSDRTPPRNHQVSPRSDRMSPRSEHNQQGDDQLYPRRDRTPPRSVHMPQRQDSVSSRNSQMSPGHDQMRQSYGHSSGSSQSPRGSDHGPHDDGLLPAELFQPELVHPDAGKAVLQPDAMETLRFQPTKSRHQRFRHRAPNQHPERKSAKKKGAPLKSELTCSECGRQFAFPFELRDHIARHRDVRPHVCTECGHQFFKEHHLKQHQLIHSGLKPFTCSICGRAFALKANMLRHTKLHVNNRQYKCQVCDKSFSQKQTLSNHMVIHKDEKPFTCTICGKKFSRKVNLDSHVYLHYGNKPFKCSICGSKYNNKGNLKRHVKNKHGLDADLQSDGEKEEHEDTENVELDHQEVDEEVGDELDTSVVSAGGGADAPQDQSENGDDEEEEESSEEQEAASTQPSYPEAPQHTDTQQNYKEPHQAHHAPNQKDFEDDQPLKTPQSYETPQTSTTQQHYSDHSRPVSHSSYEEPERPLSQRHYSEQEEAPNQQHEYVHREHARRQSYGEQEPPSRTPENYGNSEYIQQPAYPGHERIMPEPYRTPEPTHTQPSYPEQEHAVNSRYGNREAPRQPLGYHDPHRPASLEGYVPREPGREGYPTPYHAQAAYQRHGYHHVERFKIEQGEVMAPQNSMLMHPNLGLPM